MSSAQKQICDINRLHQMFKVIALQNHRVSGHEKWSGAL